MSTKNAKNESNIQKETCFVIMPFGSYFDSYYNSIYKTAISNSGMTPKRVDDLNRPSSIIQDIWGYIQKARLIIADLTNKNPNVFYELGLAHALAKPVILITQDINDIPFDLRSLRIIDYDKNNPDWGEVLKQRIEISIKETIDSPNETIPAAFLEVSNVGKTKVTKVEREYYELKQDLELIKKQVRSLDIVVNPYSSHNLKFLKDPDIISPVSPNEQQNIIDDIIMLLQEKMELKDIYDIIHRKYLITENYFNNIYVGIIAGNVS